MDNVYTELMLSTRDYLGESKPLITYKIISDPVPHQSAELEARTLMFFDGTSLGKLNVDKDVRTPITWKHYGKLSLRDPKPISTSLTHVLSTLSALVSFGTSLDPEKVYRGLRGMYEEYNGRTELVRHNWDLVFNKENRYEELRNMSIGTCTYQAKKYSPRSKHGQKVMEKFQKETGVDLSSLEEKSQIDLINTHFLDIKVSYEIPKDMIDRVLGVEAKKTSGYPNPSIVLWTDIYSGLLNPDNSKEEHRIYTITSFKGEEEIFENLLTIEGPKYPKEDRIMGITL